MELEAQRKDGERQEELVNGSTEALHDTGNGKGSFLI